MALNEKDLSQIKDIVHGETENLAQIVAKGFAETASKDEVRQLEKRTERLELNTDHMRATLDVMSRDIADIKKHFVYRDEFEDALSRIALIEKKLDLTSGK